MTTTKALAIRRAKLRQYEQARTEYFQEITRLFKELKDLGQSMAGLPEHIFNRVIPADRILRSKLVPAVLLFRVVGYNDDRHANWDVDAPEDFLGEVYYLTSKGEVYYRCEDARPLHTSNSNWVHHQNYVVHNEALGWITRSIIRIIAETEINMLELWKGHCFGD